MAGGWPSGPIRPPLAIVCGNFGFFGLFGFSRWFCLVLHGVLCFFVFFGFLDVSKQRAHLLPGQVFLAILRYSRRLAREGLPGPCPGLPGCLDWCYVLGCLSYQKAPGRADQIPLDSLLDSYSKLPIWPSDRGSIFVSTKLACNSHPMLNEQSQQQPQRWIKSSTEHTHTSTLASGPRPRKWKRIP
jgi:hypothetical protein